MRTYIAVMLFVHFCNATSSLLRLTNQNFCQHPMTYFGEVVTSLVFLAFGAWVLGKDSEA